MAASAFCAKGGCTITAMCGQTTSKPLYIGYVEEQFHNIYIYTHNDQSVLETIGMTNPH